MLIYFSKKIQRLVRKCKYNTKPLSIVDGMASPQLSLLSLYKCDSLEKLGEKRGVGCNG